MTRAGERLVTATFGGACAVLFALAVAMQIGLGRGYHWSDAAAEPVDAAGGGAIDHDAYHLPPESEFAVIAERPVFNDDRKPGPEDTAESASETPPPSPLNISLTGTVLAGKPDLRIAMVRENGKAQTITLKEGMPLPGEQGAWTLTEVKKRSAVFKSSAGEEVEVELAVASAGPKPGAPSRPGAAPPNRSPALQPPTPVAAQSEELQHRIEERRKQMREAAERMKSQRASEPAQHR